ncbi:MAG: arginine N-succinyltransferase, partial [Myxococcota bacterium]
EDIFTLAAHLDSVNIPHDRKALKKRIQKARDSFTEKIEDPTRRQYLFVLTGAESARIVGTSMVFAQHGHPESPYVYFSVVPDERYSSTLDKLFSHTTLRLGFSYHGPTEIGALVLDPGHRAYGLGKFLSLVRFLFIAMYRDRFRETVVAELMPPLLPDGRSELWEYLGQRFTGLTYQEADKLTSENKEFIYALFPQTPLYASMLPTHVAELIGKVGEETRGAQRILESIGFAYSKHIDPFDGGPHFAAKTDEIRLVREAKSRRVAHEPLDDNLERILFDGVKPEGISRHIVGCGRPEGPTRFMALLAAVRTDEDEISLTEETRRLLSIKPGQSVWSTPM